MTDRFYIGQKQIIPPAPKSESEKVEQELDKFVPEVKEIPFEELDMLSDFGVLQ